ncbi:Ankyrin repeat [Durusdinium trenchii]|uniref:PH and SEC7 domain containing protein secG n=1 Tax=Durusdinium trenchii TaxID=1381693 RepID=A0ABP0RPI9_9DINO
MFSRGQNSQSAAAAAAFDEILTLARDNDAAGILRLLEMGAPVGYANRVGQTALHIATMWGSIEAAKVLLVAKADPNAANRLRGSTPLHAAALGRGPVDRRVECVKLILKDKGDPNKADLGGDRPLDLCSDEAVRVALGALPLILHKAVAERKLEHVKEAIAQIKNGVVELDLDATNSNGESALHHACAWPEGLQALLDARCAVNVENHARRSPLHLATLTGDLRTVRLLLAAQADVHVKDVDLDRDPRYNVSSQEETPDQHRTALHYAALQSNFILAKLLVEARAAINVGDGKQMTPLHLCVQALEEHDLEVASGVRVEGLQSRPEWNGCYGSIIGPSATGSEYRVERWPVLIDGKEEGVMLKGENLSTVHLDTIDLLLKARADVNLGNLHWGEGRTLLHEVAHRGNLSLTQKVLAAKADLQRQDKQGFSALHLAARQRRSEVLRLLVESKADLTLQSEAGKTAVDLGSINGLSEQLLALLRGEEEPSPSLEAPKKPQTLEGLSAEQRAMLFID